MELISIKKTVFVELGQRIDEALDVMVEHEVSGIMVLDKGKLMGVISSKDFIKELMGEKYNNDESSQVNDFMVENPVSFLEDDISLNKLIEIVTEHSFHYYPIVDKDNNYKGTIYRRDLLKYIKSLPKTTW